MEDTAPSIPWKLTNAIRARASQRVTHPIRPYHLRELVDHFERALAAGGGAEEAVDLAAVATRAALAADPVKWDPVMLGWDNALTGLGAQQEGCKHPFVVPVGEGMGRCYSCRERGFPITPKAAGCCPGCGGAGECPPGCDKRAHQPWAVAEKLLFNLRGRIRTLQLALNNVERASLQVVGTDDLLREVLVSAERDLEPLQRMAGELLQVEVPGVPGMRIEFVDIAFIGTYGHCEPVRAWWPVEHQEQALAVLKQLHFVPKSASWAINDVATVELTWK